MNKKLITESMNRLGEIKINHFDLIVLYKRYLDYYNAGSKFVLECERLNVSEKEIADIFGDLSSDFEEISNDGN
jgi:hypothetical protein